MKKSRFEKWEDLQIYILGGPRVKEARVYSFAQLLFDVCHGDPSHFSKSPSDEAFVSSKGPLPAQKQPFSVQSPLGMVRLV